MFQVALVPDQHDDDVGVSMVPQLLQPSNYVDVCLVFGNIIYEQRSDSPAIVTAQSASTFGEPE